MILSLFKEQSTNPSRPYEWVRENTFPTSEVLVQKILAQNSKTRIIFYDTWGRPGKHENNQCGVNPTYCSFDGMQDRLTESYQSMAWINKPAEVAPVGETLRRLKNEDNFNFFETEFYDPDMTHPSLLGSFMIASVIAQKIAKVDNVAVKWKPATGVTDDQALFISKAADETINDPNLKWDFKVGDPTPCPECTNGYTVGSPVLPDFNFEDPKKDLNVLFLGNSYTERNQMTNMVKELAAKNGFTLTISQYAQNNGELSFYYYDANVLSTYITGKTYDVVVIQEQSTNPARPIPWVQENTYLIAEALVAKIERKWK